jgi:hypothetical protein
VLLELTVVLLVGSGILLVGIFVGVRAVNIYGDPAAWQPSPTWGF